MTPHYRLRHGLHWRGTRPTLNELGIDAHGILFAVIVVLAFGLVDRIDRWSEQRIATAAERDRAELNQAALLACLNGGAPGLYIERTDGSRDYLVCDAPYTVSNRNTKKTS